MSEQKQLFAYKLYFEINLGVALEYGVEYKDVIEYLQLIKKAILRYVRKNLNDNFVESIDISNEHEASCSLVIKTNRELGRDQKLRLYQTLEQFFIEESGLLEYVRSTANFINGIGRRHEWFAVGNAIDSLGRDIVVLDKEGENVIELVTE